MPATDERVPILYLAPWLDIGGSDKGTIDWFRFLNRDRFRASLITTQPSANRRLADVTPFAEEVWDLPDLMPGDEFARFILTFIHTRGVKLLHIMNSRLGYELLPDIAGLPDPPRTVVQLHVEEPDCSGYVRYVTTRYSNLVDAFSVSSQALSERVAVYEVPAAKRRLIFTGVDAEREFCPARVRGHSHLDPDAFQILFPARLTAQKAPFLMLEVAARLQDSGLSFCLHLLGDGDLRSAVEQRIRVAGLQEQVIMHGEQVDMAPWYAACDVVLLTSAYEGVPYVAYEAMAMATPLVVAALPGVDELVTTDTGILVTPREEAEPYVAAIRALAADPSRRQAMGEAGRARACEFSLERMAAEHGDLYDELLAATAEPEPEPRAEHPRVPDLNPSFPAAALRSRRPRAAPLVSVIIPCFNHGLYIDACLKSVRDQTYTPIETIVVENGSTDPDTLDALARIEEHGEATVLRLPVNRGPSPARNAAIDRARGRYVLPLDADNLLLPGAVATLVAQLRSSREQVGFIYPNYQFFGNRTDYFEPPSYNLHALLQANYCDTSSLIDREVFDRGFRYPEDIVLGNEDWDFLLTLAEHGIYGEPARARTLLFRKHGFTRADRVDAANVPFATVLAARHRALFDSGAQLKAEWNPGVSVIALDTLPGAGDEALGNLVRNAGRQTCSDFELIVRTPGEFWPTALGRRLRRIPSALAASRALALRDGLQIARGRYALAAYGSAAALLADHTLIEKALRVLSINPSIDALAFAHGDDGLSVFRLLDAELVRGARLGALCWATTGPGAPPPSLELPGDGPLEVLAGWLSAYRTVQWRHVPVREQRAITDGADAPASPLGAPRHNRPRDAGFRTTATHLPSLPTGVANRVRQPRVWMPPQTRLLCRHLNRDSQRYVFTNDHISPPGYSLQYALGCLRALPLAGTKSLTIDETGGESGFALDRQTDLDAPALLGYVEQAPLPLFDPLQIGRDRVTGQRVLFAGHGDPLAATVDEVVSIGYIEPHPIHPRRQPHQDVAYRLVGLVRALDLDARCHRYGAGVIPHGRLAGELGSLLAEPIGDCAPLWIGADGRALTDRPAQVNGRPALRTTMRWTGAPLTWRQVAPLRTKMRASARRAYDSARILTSGPATRPRRPGVPAGYLLRTGGDRTVPLYAAVHPVTGDQLLSTVEAEPRYLGYANVQLLGHLIPRAPVTGTLGVVRPGVPWAARFGLVVGGS